MAWSPLIMGSRYLQLLRRSRAETARPTALSSAISRSSAQVLRHVPRPHLDYVPVGVVDVGGAAVAVRELDLLDLLAALAQPRHGGVVVLLGDLHREVNVQSAAAARQADLRPPQADARALAGHHPDRLAVGPALHHRQAEHAGVELLRRLEIHDLQYQLRHAGDRDPGAHIPSAGSHSSKRLPSGSTAQPNRPTPSWSCLLSTISTPAERRRSSIASRSSTR